MAECEGEISEKVLKFEKFVNEVLRDDLRAFLHLISRRAVPPPPEKFQNALKLKKYKNSQTNSLNAYTVGVERKVIDQRDKVYEQLAEYYRLKNTIQILKDSKPSGPLHSKVDLGCNFYCQARATDPSHIFIAVGLGFYVEFTLDEALRFIDKKCDQLNEQSDQLTKNISSIKAQIKFVIEGIRELQGIPDTPTETSNRVDL